MDIKHDDAICLYEHIPQGMQYLIVLDAKGAPYTNQTGGTACAHPVALGYLLPFRFSHELEELDRWVRDDWFSCLHADDWGGPSNLEELFGYFPKDHPILRAATLDEIKAAVDAGLVDDSFGEAWFPVVIKDIPRDQPWYNRGPQYPFPNRLAILVWENSD